MRKVTILIPTKNRSTALAATLTSVLSQTYQNFSIIISDQSTKYDITSLPTFQTLQRIFKEHGIHLAICKHSLQNGLAEQRQFLLEKSQTPYSLFLDDDCILEPYVLSNLLKTIEKEQCGFVGQAVIGLSYKDDIRTDQQFIEFWDGNVEPEKITPHSPKWQRYQLHNAANMLHIQKKLHLTPQNPKPYKIAWVGGCVLYATEKLKSVGGFSFWRELPKEHAGEDVYAQMQVMEKYGGCAILPSGVYHQELPTTIPNRQVNAPEYFHL